MTRLHRDAPPAEFAAPPRFTTHGPPAVTWRSDLIQVAIAAVVVLAIGFFLVISLAILLRSWTVLAAGLWLTVFGSLTPFLLLAHMIIRELSDRHMLNRTRVWAESQMLTGWLDTDEDGQLEDDELAAFLDYVRHLHRGGRTTAADASRLYRIPGPTWQKYRDALITLGYAYADSKRGGIGFELRPSVRLRPWPELEADLTKRAGLLVRAQDNPGMLITQPQQNKLPRRPAPVSSLAGDLYDASNTDGD